MKQSEELGIGLISRIKNSINNKFFLITSTILILISIIIYIFIIIIMPIYYQRYEEKQTEVIVNKLENKLIGSTYEDSTNIFDNFFDNNNEILAVVLFNKNGDYVETPSKYMAATFSMDNTTEDLFKMSYYYERNPVNRNREFKDGMIGLSEGLVKAKLLIKSITFKNDEKYHAYILYDIQPIDDALSVMIKLIPLVLIIIFIVAITCSFLYSRFITKPIIKISKTAERMAIDKNLILRCNVSGNDEIGIMSKSINQLAASLSQSLEELKEMNTILQDDIQKEKEMDKKRRDLFNAVSHELKTPITIIKGQLEGMISNVGVYKDRDKFLHRSLSVADKMDELVREILMISKLEDSNLQLSLEKVELKSIIEEVMDELEGLIDKNEIVVNKTIAKNLFVEVDYSLFKKAISNIIKNAIIYSPNGATVSIDANKYEQTIHIEVVNTEVTIPNGDIEKIFEPYYRVDKSRNKSVSGSGIGLYIVRNILNAHKFEFSINNILNAVSFKINIETKDNLKS